MNTLRSRPRARSLRLLSAAALLVGLLGNLGAAQPVQAASLTVTTTADELNTDGDCALREAVRATNLDMAVDACPAGSGADTITLPAGTYTLRLVGINEDAALTGDLDLTGALTITGADAATTIIDGGSFDRIFNVRATANVTLNALTVSNGLISGWTGGGIYNTGTLTINSSVVSGNRVDDYDGGGRGGGIMNRGTLTLNNSTVSGNVAESYNQNSGAGIANDAGAIMTITRSSIRDNIADGGQSYGGKGGAISNEGTMTVADSTISGNVAKTSSWYQNGCSVGSRGGGIHNGDSGTLTLTNSTVSTNTAGGSGCSPVFGGGGISNEGTLTLSSSTITANIVQTGPGGGIDNSYGDGSVTLRNTSLAGNRSSYSRDCYGPVTSQGYNLINYNDGCTISGDTTGNLRNVNTLRGPLRDNGGPTWTQMLRPGSAGVDAGNPATPGSGGNACPATDQRGVSRLQDGNGDGIARCDIGAAERADNLLLNGGFERDSNADGTPDAWSYNARATRSNAAARSGTYALRHQATDNASYTVFSDPVVAVAAGRSYIVSGWVNIPATSDAFSLELQVRWRDASSNILSTVPVQTYSAATNGWTSFTATLVAPANATQATIRQVVSSLNATLYVDDVRVQLVDDLVINSSFEQDSNADGTPDGWSANPRATRSNATARSDSYALRHQATDDASYTIFSDPAVPIVPGELYTFTSWVNIPPTTDSFSLELQVRWRDAAGNVLSTETMVGYHSPTNGWDGFGIILVAPTNAAQVTIRQVVTSLNATIYVDNLSFGP